MNNYSLTLKKQLLSLIDNMATDKSSFVKNPDKDFTRNRKLTFTDLIRFLLSLGGSNSTKELMEFFSYSPDMPSTPALFQQRDKLNDFALKYLFQSFTQKAMPDNLRLWKGYNLIAVDGSSIIIPTDRTNPDTFILSNPKASSGHNQLHLNTLYDLNNHLYLDAQCQSFHDRSETKAFVSMIEHKHFHPKSIFIGDRGYCSLNNMAHVLATGCHFLFRAKDTTSNGLAAYLPLPESDEFDYWITLDLSRTTRKSIISKCSNYKRIRNDTYFDYLEKGSLDIYSLTFRVTRVKLDNSSYELIFSNLDNETFSPDDLKALYNKRWGIETSFRQLKYSVGLVNFHSKKVDYILQEIFARLILYNFCELITWPVVITKDSTKHCYKVNFTRTVEVCKYFLSKRSDITPPDVEAIIQQYTIPIRLERKYPRKIGYQSAVYFVYRVA